jgi:hypothetical protein
MNSATRVRLSSENLHHVQDDVEDQKRSLLFCPEDGFSIHLLGNTEKSLKANTGVVVQEQATATSSHITSHPTKE